MTNSVECNSCGDKIPEYHKVYSEEKFNVCHGCVLEEGLESIFERLKDEAE